jgi:5-methylthioribose kinase
MSWVSHQVQEGNTPYAHFILESIEGIWNNFKEKFLLLWSATQESALVTQGFTNSDVMSCYQQEFMHQLLQDSIGFAGCKIIRRQFGIAGVEDIRGIRDDLLRERANRDAVAIGVNFIKKHNHINSIKEIITILKEHYAG